ncbi:potassium channel family protein [Bernardetia litoralis]|nr:potassium channel family protein [Bernardetia litoralis]
MQISSPVWVMIFIEFVLMINLFLVYQFNTSIFVLSTITINSYLLLYFAVYIWVLPSQYKIFSKPQKEFKNNIEEIHRRNFDITLKTYNTQFYYSLFIQLSNNKITKNDLLFSLSSIRNTERLRIDEQQTALKHTISTDKQLNYIVFSSILLATVLNYSFLLLLSLKNNLLSINNLSESSSFIDCLYFIVVTISTLGYGDMYPTSTLAKILVISIMSILLFFLNSVVALSETIIQNKHNMFMSRLTEYNQNRLNSLDHIENFIYYNQLETSESKKKLEEIAKKNIFDESFIETALSSIDKIKNKI